LRNTKRTKKRKSAPYAVVQKKKKFFFSATDAMLPTILIALALNEFLMVSGIAWNVSMRVPAFGPAQHRP
jgi:hypothetical protein